VTDPVTAARRLRWGATAWIVSVLQYFACQLIVAGRWSTPYSWKNNFISDLGNTACGPFAVPHGRPAYVCSPAHTVMNASFIVAGILTVIGILLLRPLWTRSRAARAGVVLWVIAGLGKIIVGLAPENGNIGLHTLGALNIPLGGIAILLLSRASSGLPRPWRIAGRLLAGVGLIGTVLSIAGQYGGTHAYFGTGAGGSERLAGYPANLWFLLIAALVLTVPAPVNRDVAPISR
jgi:hypothetical membrane protein